MNKMMSSPSSPGLACAPPPDARPLPPTDRTRGTLLPRSLLPPLGMLTGRLRLYGAPSLPPSLQKLASASKASPGWHEVQHTLPFTFWCGSGSAHLGLRHLEKLLVGVLLDALTLQLCLMLNCLLSGEQSRDAAGCFKLSLIQ